MHRPWPLIASGLLATGLLAAGDLPNRSIRANLMIAMQFDSPFSSSSLREMKSEFERIMRPAGPSIEWRMLNDVANNEAFHEIIVVRFRGSSEAGGSRATMPINAVIVGIILATRA